MHIGIESLTIFIIRVYRIKIPIASSLFFFFWLAKNDLVPTIEEDSTNSLFVVSYTHGVKGLHA